MALLVVLEYVAIVGHTNKLSLCTELTMSVQIGTKPHSDTETREHQVVE